MNKLQRGTAALLFGLSTAVAGIAVAAPAVNQNAIQTKTVTVKTALGLADDTKVQLKGYVVKAIGDEKYQFRDSTGSITVDIDDDLWQGKAVSAKTLITIRGEVDVDRVPQKRVEIDVDQIQFH